MSSNDIPTIDVVSDKQLECWAALLNNLDTGVIERFGAVNRIPKHNLQRLTRVMLQVKMALCLPDGHRRSRYVSLWLAMSSRPSHN